MTIDLSISIMASIIAIAALIVAIWQGAETRHHNRLSVKPIAIISVGDYLKELVVYLQNKGTGPMIIKDLSFTGENSRKEKSIIDYFGEDFRGVVWSTFVSDIDGWAILPAETKTLVKLEGDPTDEDFLYLREKVRKVLATIQVNLLYQDIYGNEMPIKTRKLDFFAR